MKALVFGAALLLAGVLSAQSSRQVPPARIAGGYLPGGAPPINIAASPSGWLNSAGIQVQIQSLIPAAKASGSSGKTLGDAGTYKVQLSVRTASGGAEVHAHWDDVMLVEEGCATLITGGTVADGRTDADGETHGTRIDGGHSQLLTPGDIVTVHAGTPHQVVLAPDTVYGAIVVKIHEP